MEHFCTHKPQIAHIQLKKQTSDKQKGVIEHVEVNLTKRGQRLGISLTKDGDHVLINLMFEICCYVIYVRWPNYAT
jgi:hypothetical protein